MSGLPAASDSPVAGLSGALVLFNALQHRRSHGLGFRQEEIESIFAVLVDNFEQHVIAPDGSIQNSTTIAKPISANFVLDPLLT